jgi:hypothetical protein
VRGVGPPSVQSMTPMSAKRSDATRLYVIASGTGSHPTDLAAEPRCRGGGTDRYHTVDQTRGAACRIAPRGPRWRPSR